MRSASNHVGLHEPNRDIAPIGCGDLRRYGARTEFRYDRAQVAELMVGQNRGTQLPADVDPKSNLAPGDAGQNDRAHHRERRSRRANRWMPRKANVNLRGLLFRVRVSGAELVRTHAAKGDRVTKPIQGWNAMLPLGAGATAQQIRRARLGRE